jgi:ligand-binding SRPBCC domain-containing protein
VGADVRRTAPRTPLSTWWSAPTRSQRTAVVEVVTRIAAPRELCFDLARDVEVHCETAAFTGERAVPPGRTSGLLAAGDLVVFEGRHFGLRLRLGARVTEMDRPRRFVDEAVSGPFRRLRHVHEFETADGDATVMRDTVEWTAPLGALGRLADTLFLRRHMARFVTRKQARLKQTAEGG